MGMLYDLVFRFLGLVFEFGFCKGGSGYGWGFLGVI